MPRHAVCLVKPDGMDRIAEIRSYLQDQGIMILKEVDWQITEEDVEVLYLPVLQSQPYAVNLVKESMVTRTVHIMLCEGDEDLFVRFYAAKQYLRATYKKDNPKGIVHTSDNEEEAEREIAHFLAEGPVAH